MDIDCIHKPMAISLPKTGKELLGFNERERMKGLTILLIMGINGIVLLFVIGHKCVCGPYRCIRRGVGIRLYG